MKRVIIYCEGASEETFINNILSPALLMSGVFVVATSFGGVSKYSIIRKKLVNLCRSDKSALLSAIQQAYPTPEHINNSPNTAPSKRILQVYNDYDKVLDGYNIAKNIGLDKIRKNCRHFDNWVMSLENLV